MKFGHLFDMLLVSTGVGTSALLAGAGGGDVGGGGSFSIPSYVLGPICIGAFTVITFFLKQYYSAMVNVMTRQNAQLVALNDKFAGIDKRLAVVEILTRASSK